MWLRPSVRWAQRMAFRMPSPSPTIERSCSRGGEKWGCPRNSPNKSPNIKVQTSPSSSRKDTLWSLGRKSVLSLRKGTAPPKWRKRKCHLTRTVSWPPCHPGSPIWRQSWRRKFKSKPNPPPLQKSWTKRLSPSWGGWGKTKRRLRSSWKKKKNYNDLFEASFIHNF